MSIRIDMLRKKIDKNYVGFGPNTSSVKPVHIANGIFRAVSGRTANTSSLNKFVFTQTKKGVPPKGHELDTVFERLNNDGKIDSVITKETIQQFRILLKTVVSADDGVFYGGMESYSAGYKDFVSKDTIGSDGGEFIAQCMSNGNVKLVDCLLESLKNPDVISMMCAPLLDDTSILYTSDLNLKELKSSQLEISAEILNLVNGLREAANTLNDHLVLHPNKLIRLRLIVLFSCYCIIRYLSCLEGIFIKDSVTKVPPFVFDFSGRQKNAPLGRASLTSYNKACQSLSRFYAWAFGEVLKEEYSLETLTSDEVPFFKKENNKEEMKEIWGLAIDEAKSKNTTQPYLVLGQALYDMMAISAEGNPIVYFRNLGHRCGLLWPPNQTGQRFVVTQDLLETLVRGAVGPGEIIDLPTLQERFWCRYGILVGGRPQDEQILIDSGIYQADSNAFRDNRKRFTERLRELDFAKLLADGVLQVELEVHHEDR